MTVRPRRRIAALVVLLAGLPGAARAHAILLDSQPAAAGQVAAGHLDIRLHFNSRIDPTRSRVTLIRPDHGQATLRVDGVAEDVLSAATDLAPGRYTLRWQVLAIDGHITRGDVPFTATGH